MGRTSESWAFPWFRNGDRETAIGIMDRLGITHLAKRHIRDLSGGQQQRAFLARALVSGPRLCCWTSQRGAWTSRRGMK